MDRSPCRGCHLEFKDKNNPECESCNAKTAYVEKMSSRPSEPFKTEIIKKEKKMQKTQKVKIEKPKTKMCKKCGKVKVLTDFSINNNKPDGLDYMCRLCRSEYKKAWVLKKKENASKREARAIFKKSLETVPQSGVYTEHPDPEEKPMPAPEKIFVSDYLTKTQFQIVTVCDEIKKMLLDKNRKYGDSAIHPQRIFSKADPEQQILIRLDDKLSRWASCQEDDTEDIITDMIGYLVLLKIVRAKTND